MDQLEKFVLAVEGQLEEFGQKIAYSRKVYQVRTPGQRCRSGHTPLTATSSNPRLSPSCVCSLVF